MASGTTQMDVEVQQVNIGEMPDGSREANVVAVLYLPVAGGKKIVAQLAFLTTVEDAPRVADVYELTIKRKSVGRLALV